MTDPLGLLNNISQIQQPSNLQRNQSVDENAPSFKDVLLDNIKQVNDLQQEAEKAIEDLAAGRRDDIASVMIAKEKSDIAFKMLLQVRNKLVDAYNDIKDIRV